MPARYPVADKLIVAMMVEASPFLKALRDGPDEAPAGLGEQPSITDRDPGDESGLATSAAQDIAADVLMRSQIAALTSERDFWRGNYENMKRMRDALLPDDERPKPNPFANALKHSTQPIGLVR